MVILAVIILIVSGMFRQSRTAWDIGTRKTDSSMAGRAAVSFMAQELAQAVSDGPGRYYGTPNNNGNQNSISSGNTIGFWTLGSTTNNGARIAKFIQYSGGGSVTRQCWNVDVNNTYPNTSSGSAALTLANNANVTFATPGGSNYTVNLPAYVDITLTLSASANYSTIVVSSGGPPGGPQITSGSSQL